MIEISDIISEIRKAKKRGEVCNTIVMSPRVCSAFVDGPTYPAMPLIRNSDKRRKRKKEAEILANQIAKTVGSKVV